MRGKGGRAAATLAAILIALLLGACGGDSSSTETSATDSGESRTTPEGPSSGARPNAWNTVNSPIAKDILKYGHVGTAEELEEASVTLRGYLIARRGGNSAKACSYLSDYMVAVVKGTAEGRGERGCVAGVDGLASISSADEVEGPVRIDPKFLRTGSKGRRTFVIFEDNFGDRYAMLMRHEGGTWFIQGFEPTRLS